MHWAVFCRKTLICHLCKCYCDTYHLPFQEKYTPPWQRCFLMAVSSFRQIVRLATLQKFASSGPKGSAANVLMPDTTAHLQSCGVHALKGSELFQGHKLDLYNIKQVFLRVANQCMCKGSRQYPAPNTQASQHTRKVNCLYNNWI